MPSHTRISKSSRTELDFTLENHGSLFSLRPLTSAAKDLMNEHLPMDNPEIHFWGDAIVIEPRYVAPIVDGIIGDGLVLRWLPKLRAILKRGFETTSTSPFCCAEDLKVGTGMAHYVRGSLGWAIPNWSRRISGTNGKAASMPRNGWQRREHPNEHEHLGISDRWWLWRTKLHHDKRHSYLLGVREIDAQSEQTCVRSLPEPDSPVADRRR